MGRHNNKRKDSSDKNNTPFQSRGGRDRNDDNRFEGSRGGGFNRPPREMHTTTCSECQKECQVPFKPTGNKPVYCRECFEKHKPKRY